MIRKGFSMSLASCANFPFIINRHLKENAKMYVQSFFMEHVLESSGNFEWSSCRTNIIPKFVQSWFVHNLANALGDYDDTYGSMRSNIAGGKLQQGFFQTSHCGLNSCLNLVYSLCKVITGCTGLHRFLSSSTSTQTAPEKVGKNEHLCIISLKLARVDKIDRELHCLFLECETDEEMDHLISFNSG